MPEAFVSNRTVIQRKLSCCMVLTGPVAPIQELSKPDGRVVLHDNAANTLCQCGLWCYILGSCGKVLLSFIRHLCLGPKCFNPVSSKSVVNIDRLQLA